MAVPAPDREALRLLGQQAKPLTTAGERVLPAPEPLVPLLPEGGLRRGSTVATGGIGGTALALALAGASTATGSWVAVVGLGRLGLLAGAELGLRLDRVVLVAEPEPAAWSTVVAALLDAFEVVLVRPSRRLAPAEQRRLQARARDRGSVLLQAGGRTDVWADAPDLVVRAVDVAWRGLGPGHGHLQARRLTVEVTGRRGAARPRRADVWLPSITGTLEAAEPAAAGWTTVEPEAPRRELQVVEDLAS